MYGALTSAIKFPDFIHAYACWLFIHACIVAFACICIYLHFSLEKVLRTLSLDGSVRFQMQKKRWPPTLPSNRVTDR
jgi:hypothetical protein